MFPRPCKTLLLSFNKRRFGKVGRLASEDVVFQTGSSRWWQYRY